MGGKGARRACTITSGAGALPRRASNVAGLPWRGPCAGRPCKASLRGVTCPCPRGADDVVSGLGLAKLGLENAGRALPLGRNSGVSSRLLYACQISMASPQRAFKLGSILAKCPRMFSASRRKNLSELELCDAETICGKSITVGPAAAHSTLYAERSPWMRSQARIPTSCASMSW